MTARLVDYEGQTHYPIAHIGCDGCEHDLVPGRCAEFTVFVKTKSQLNSSCTQGGIEVIWQTGDAARFKYSVERLTIINPSNKVNV